MKRLGGGGEKMTHVEFVEELIDSRGIAGEVLGSHRRTIRKRNGKTQSVEARRQTLNETLCSKEKKKKPLAMGSIKVSLSLYKGRILR